MMIRRKRPPIANQDVPGFAAALAQAETAAGDLHLVSLPWVGNRYFSEPVRVATLFESNNYAYDSTEPDDETKLHWNVGLGAKAVSGVDPVRFLTKTARTVGKLLHGEDWQGANGEALHRVTYSNFLQPFMTHNRGEPPPEWARSSRASFLQLIERLQPNVLLSFSRGRLRRWLYETADEIGTQHVRRPAAALFVPFKIGETWVLNSSHPSGSFAYNAIVDEFRAQLLDTGFDLRGAGP